MDGALFHSPFWDLYGYDRGRKVESWRQKNGDHSIGHCLAGARAIKHGARLHHKAHLKEPVRHGRLLWIPDIRSLRSVETWRPKAPTNQSPCVLHTTTAQEKTCRGHRPRLASTAKLPPDPSRTAAAAVAGSRYCCFAYQVDS